MLGTAQLRRKKQGKQMVPFIGIVMVTRSGKTKKTAGTKWLRTVNPKATPGHVKTVNVLTKGPAAPSGNLTITNVSSVVMPAQLIRMPVQAIPKYPNQGLGTGAVTPKSGARVMTLRKVPAQTATIPNLRVVTLVSAGVNTGVALKAGIQKGLPPRQTEIAENCSIILPAPAETQLNHPRPASLQAQNPRDNQSAEADVNML